MPTQTLKTCGDSHEQIAYETSICPCCKLKGEMADLLNNREDIDQMNIETLYRELKSINKRLNRLDPVKRPWTASLFPWKKQSQLMPAVPSHTYNN